MTSQPAITLTQSPPPVRPAPAANVVNIGRTDRELRRQLTRFSKWMYRLGFAPGTSGNLSVRLDNERILATPTGCSKYLLRPVDMVVVDLDGKLLFGTRN